MVIGVRGALIGFALSPLLYVLHSLVSKARILLTHKLCPIRDKKRAFRFVQNVSEPPEVCLPYDYAAITVLHTTSLVCLLFACDARVVFGLDVVWGIAMRFLNKYVYFVLGRESYYTSTILDDAFI